MIRQHQLGAMGYFAWLKKHEYKAIHDKLPSLAELCDMLHEVNEVVEYDISTDEIEQIAKESLAKAN